MRAIILAAGRGSRLGAAGDSKPKCLMTLASKTLLQWQLEAYAAAGIDQIGLVTGYRRQDLASYGQAEFHNENWERGTMVHSLLRAREWLLTEECIVSYGDIVYDASALKLLKHAEADLSMTYTTRWRELWGARFSDPRSDLEKLSFGPGGVVAEIGGRPKDLDRVQGQFMGLFKTRPQGFRDLLQVFEETPESESAKMDVTAWFSKAISAELKIVGLPFDGVFAEVDSVADRDLYESKGWWPKQSDTAT